MDMEEDIEESIVIEEGFAQEPREMMPALLHESVGPTPEAIASVVDTAPRGRKRVAFEPLEEQPSSSRRRTAGREVLPIDNEVHQYFPCPVADCDAVYQNRAERSFHIRADHSGYKYTEGDGQEKIRHFPDEVPLEASEAHLVRQKHRSDLGREFELEEHLEDEELLEPEIITDRFEQKPPVLSSVDEMMSDGSGYSEETSEPPTTLEMRHLGEEEFKMIQPKEEYTEEADSCGTSQCSMGMEQTRPLNRDDEMFRKNILLGPRRRGRPRSAPGSEPAPNSKIRIADPNGKYRCYIPDCDWRGGYRSIRAEHMKWCHKDWKKPARYILQRLSQGDSGGFWDAEKNQGDLTCFVQGCEWRGIYRASRSAHMRSAHPEYQQVKKKAPLGGFIPDGKYECHDPHCGWRGASRSTRAAHMKREHPGFMNPMYQPRMLLCTDCNAQCITHKTFVDHLVCEHRIGGSVQREFNDIRDYEEWYEAVQDSFSVDFIKKMGVKQTESYQVLYLYCSRSNGCRPKKAKSDPYVPSYSKSRNLARPFRTRNHCAAFLRVVHWNDGKLTVVGCVEHTGHRLGTSLLRLSPSERELLDEYLYVHDEESELDLMIERLRDVEGFVADGYEAAPRTHEEISHFVLNQDDQMASLKMLLESPVIPPNTLFNVNVPVDPSDASFLSLGIMTEDMQRLWRENGHRAVCFEEVRLVINNWDVSLIFVLTFDENMIPRCCCLYISKDSDRMAVIRQLHHVDPRPIETLVTDAAPEWADMLEQVYGEASYSFDLQVAEWHLLPEWAHQLDQMVPNRVDRFTILCCLRRWLRASDPTLFEAMIIDMFEAFRELEVDDLSQMIDEHLSDPYFSKRWSPLNRNPDTEHANPTLEIACRMFREKFLNCDMCTRIDEYVGLLMHRVEEFNNCAISQPYATGSVEPPRQLPMYDVVDPNQVLADGTLIVQQQHAPLLITRADGHQSLLLDDKNQLLHVREEIEEELEEVEEEEIVMDMEELHENEEVIPLPSTSAVVLEESQVAGSSDGVVKHEGDGRKERLNAMMEVIKRKMDEITGEQDIHLLENHLSQVVEQLDGSISSQETQ